MKLQTHNLSGVAQVSKPAGHTEAMPTWKSAAQQVWKPALHHIRRTEAVALVITLLMLSVITFLTIAFLAMSQRNKNGVSVGIDLANARAASDAARARAQTEIIAQMLAHGDALYYDYMASSAYQGSGAFNATEGNVYDPTNVNYDSFMTNRNGYNSANYAQMIANLWYDPRPPVFVVTNQAYPNNYDFRFWVDINRNGKFETNGYQPAILDNGFTNGSYEFLNGEPEWVGILKNPLYPHSFTNQFIGRYAYLVLPIGKQLDFNYIHNFLKGVNGRDGYLTNASSYSFGENDGFARDQGIGSWELNLGAVLDNLSPWAYEANNNSYPGYPTRFSPYNYFPPNGASTSKATPNTGNAFDDAEAILNYRYDPNPSYPLFLAPLSAVFPSNYLDYQNNFIDMYCSLASVTNYSSSNAPIPYPNQPWPGSYQTNLFYDVQDLFDPNKTSPNFANRMIVASERTNTFDRYTFQRLLSSVGMGSSPEYGVWVHGDNGAPILRTKMNINYDNTSQMNSPNAPYAPMPTTLTNWTPIGFFMNAAELLLRSQTFGYTNYLSNTLTVLPNQPLFTNFGVTEIPIYRTNAPGVRYNASVHRMLQLAANIYDATVGTNYESAGTTKISGANLPPVRHPSVFRPVFGLVTNGGYGINIIGYVQMSNTIASGPGSVGAQLTNTFYELPAALAKLQASSANSNINIWGIPWVVGANKGLPQFYQYSYQSSVLYERKLLFDRQPFGGLPNTNAQPFYTNQFYCMTITNNFGMDVWNPYPSNFSGSLSTGGGTTIYISNYITVQFTNNYNWGTNLQITNLYPTPSISGAQIFTNLPPWGGGNNGFRTYFGTNVTTLPPGYFSQYYNRFIYFTNPAMEYSNQFLSVDTNQTLSSPGYPVYDWTLNISNHLVYALYDGLPSTGGVLLDFVNLGPFGSSVHIQQLSGGSTNDGSNPGNNGLAGTLKSLLPMWTNSIATPYPSSAMSEGLLNQILNCENGPDTNFLPSVKGVPTKSTVSINSGYVFGAPIAPTNVVYQFADYVANDPLVHYTLDDLTPPNQVPAYSTTPFPLVTSTNLGSVNRARYGTWNGGDTVGEDMLFKDPLMYSPTNWDFPTNKFPSIGWLGRVHRGTPWQTVYLKADNPKGTSQPRQAWVSKWLPACPWFNGESCPETYPTNDWALIDLFTTAPDDNAARGLLSVNQTNDAAWAAVFAGVIAPTNSTNGIQIMPINDVSNLVDQYSTNGSINALRANYANGIFHKVGDILGAAALTTQSPFLGGNAANYSDEIVERIPQQTLSLLKLGEPQFVIFAYGQSLKPKGAPYLAGGGANNNIYTNYEITGEVVTRTVCHVVHTNGVKMVIDSFNVESGSGN